MNITKIIPDPPELKEPNLKYVERGWGWKIEGKKNYVYWCWRTHGWKRVAKVTPFGNRNRFYIEIVEDFPMPPDELDGYRLTFVPEGEWEEKLIGENYAFFYDGCWKVNATPRILNGFLNKAYALAEKIETQVDDFGNEMPSSLPPMPEAPEGYKRKYEVGPTQRMELGSMLDSISGEWRENWELRHGNGMNYHYIRLVPEKRYWSKPSHLPSSNILELGRWLGFDQ